MTRTKLQKILNKLDNTNEGTLGAIRDFESGVKSLREKLQKEIQANTLDEVNLKINRFRKELDLSPLLDSLSNLEEAFKESILGVLNDIETKSVEFKTLSDKGTENLNTKSSELNKEIDNLKSNLDKIVSSNIESLSFINQKINSLKTESSDYIKKNEVLSIQKDIQKKINELSSGKEEDVKVIKDSIDNLRVDFMSRLANRGGGNANRNIAIGGNTSVLSKFTDINLKAGNNVTITYTNNNTTKYTDITISATGGGGSVGGTIRSINNVSTSQVMGDTAGTDYVYIASEGIKLDLPTATGNTNLYTIKNVSNSSVLVTGTIDNDANGAIMPIKYTSIDLISNDTDWNIT